MSDENLFIPSFETREESTAAPPAPVKEPSAPPKPAVAAPKEEPDAERQIRALSRRSFLWGAAAVTTGFVGWRGLIHQRDVDGIPWPFRLALQANENLARDYFQGSRLAPTFPRAQAGEPRANGDAGLSDGFEPADWTLSVEGVFGKDEPLTLTLDDIKKLPRVEMVTELKCIEGWSQIVHWVGVRFADFAKQYPPATRSGDPPNVEKKPEDLVEYVSMKTPDEGYYVGLDMESALHPQTLLCYEMNGEPLTLDHGAPLRLVIPVKYGIKNIKRIGTITYASQRPTDYWAEQGYDWYAGH